MRYTPFDSVDRMVDQMRRDMLELRASLADSWPAIEGATFGTDVDLTEHDDEFVLTVDMPGFEREEIDLRFDDGVLYLTAEHAVTDETSVRRRAIREQVSVPRAVEAEAVTAAYHNGVLEVHLPIVEGAAERGHRIDVD